MKKRILIAICVGLLISMALVVAIAYGNTSLTSENGGMKITNQMSGQDSVITPSLYRNSDGTWSGIDSLNNMSTWVSNDSENASAYIRTIFAFEAGDLSLGEFHDLLCIKINTYSWTWPANSSWTEITIDGERYFMVTAMYNSAVAAGGATEASLLGIGMDWSADNARLQDAGFGDGLTIRTHSQAVESSEFSTAAAAFETAYKEPTVTNHPWNVAYVSTFEELMEALGEGRDVVLVDDITMDYGSITIN